MVLVNVLHFNSDWLVPFDNVANGNFRTGDGQTISVPMMETETEMG